jgi:asparagine synthase (glutamine-hydrolysing)
MCDSIAHRGPDGEGYWVAANSRVGFGHRRLAIIDLSTLANQPMTIEDRSVWIVFNGEIYNHAEIRQELEALGDRLWLTDHSDTEVILRAYKRWGIDAIHRFRGMFAFALWDEIKKELFLVRDRIGIKPLYFTQFGERLSFASEIKALIADPECPRAIDEEAMFHYLSFYTAPAPSTLFRGISKLPPGTWARIDSKGCWTERRYWDAWDHVYPMLQHDEGEIAERVLGQLRTSVRYRKVSDVRVGVFLSGGLDSSANAILFREGEQNAVKTFSIGYKGNNGSYLNEFEYARRIANQIGAEHYELELSIDDLLDFVPRMVWLQDEPIADPVCVPHYYVSKLARENGVTVAQIGEGADELFCGYPSWLTYLRVQKMDGWPLPNALKNAGLPLLAAAGMSRGRQYELLRRGANKEPVFWSGAEAFTDFGKRCLLGPRLRESFREHTSWDVVAPVRKRFEDKAWDKSGLNWMTYADLNMRLPELLLMRADKMSMGVGLEGRVPFLDHKFVEMALSIPTCAKLHGNVTKHILKKAVRNVVPDDIVDRPKQAFSVPIGEWFLDRLGGEMRSRIDDFCRNTDLIDPKEVDWLFRHKKSAHLWIVFNLAVWWRTYIAGHA